MFKKVLSYSIGLYASMIFASLVRILVKSLIAKTLGKEALGAYAYYSTIILLGSALLAFGLRRTISKEVAARKEERQFAAIVTAVMAAFVIASLALSGVALLLHRRLDWIYVLILIGIGPATLFDIACATLRGQFDQKREVGALLLGAITQVACITALVLFSRSQRAPVWGMTAAYGLLAIATLLYFRRRFRAEWQPSRIWRVFQSNEFRFLLLLATPLWITDIIGIVGQQADQWILQGQLGYTVLAEYAAAYTFIGLMDQPINVLSRVFLVTFAGGYYNDLDRYARVVSLNLLLFSVLGLGVIFLSIPLTPVLFTNAYTLVPTLVLILTISSVFSSVEVVNSSLTIAQDYPQANRNAKVLATALYIPLAFYLVSRYGVHGAAWSNVASWVGYTLIHILYMRKRLPEHGKHAARTLLLGTALYMGVILAIWLLKFNWLVALTIPIYVGAGQILHLWDITQIPALAGRLLPQSMSLKKSL